MPASEESIRGTIRTYIENEYFPGRANELANDTRLITDGFVDSVAVMVLVDFLENAFGFEFEPYEVDADNLDTLDLMTRFVSKKLG